MKPLKVKCHFCKELVLDLTCDEVEITLVINTRPKVVKKVKVHRCMECKDKHENRG